MGTDRTVAISLFAECACLVGVVVAVIELWRRRSWRIPDANERFAAVAPYVTAIATSCAGASTVAHWLTGDGALAGILALLGGAACGAVAAGGLMLLRRRNVQH